MLLELTIHTNYISVIAVNTSSHELRLWELHNSWGWYSFSIELRDPSNEQVHIIERKPREWTKNGPTYFVVPPGQRHEIQLNIHDGWWEIDKNLLSLKDDPIPIRARLKIDPSPEAQQYDVFIGTLFSDWAISMSPHGWLFAANSSG